MPDRQLWERQPEETDRAWAAFQVYRNMPPSERSYDAAWRKTYAKPTRLRSPQWYRTWSNHHNWKKRTEAWDRHLDDVERAAMEQERVDWRKDRRKILRGFMTILAQAMQNFDPADATMNQLTRATEMIVQEMRAEMDDLPTERRKVDLRIEDVDRAIRDELAKLAFAGKGPAANAAEGTEQS